MGPHTFTDYHQKSQSIGDGELVVTVPGMLARCGCMRDLTASLCGVGYQTWHWNYPSLRGSIAKHATQLAAGLIDVARSPAVSRIHFVTHSMGSVIARAAILLSRLETRFFAKCGRIVMLAPPNSGSRLTRLPLGPLATWFPQLSELSESPNSYVCRLPQLQTMSVGVIAAERDFVVDAQATHLAGERDHATLPTTHQRLVSDFEAIAMTIRFLRSDGFDSKPQTQIAHDRQRHAVAA